MTSRIYSFDTSALIDGLERYYPEQNFPLLWERVDSLVEQGRFLISEEVWYETKKKDEVAKCWAEPRLGDIMVPTDLEVAAATQGVLEDFPLLVKNFKGRNRADPFVIGTARTRNAIVVTGEGSDGTANRPKIPYICNELGIRCYRFLEVVQAERWSF